VAAGNRGPTPTDEQRDAVLAGRTWPILFRRTGEGPARNHTVASRNQWDEQDRVALSQLWKKKKAEEPIAHELLREANHLAEDTPLSALLIAASALEVGAKSYVSALVPAAEWLVENLPAPPTYKILKDYISQLPTRVAVDWSKLKKLFTTAKELAEERNKVTHSTGHVPSKEKLQTFLNCVSELLYIIDVSQGHEWAKDHVTKATRGMLGWTLSRKRSGRGFVTLRIGD